MDKIDIKLTKERVATEFYISPIGKVVKWKGTLKEANYWASLHALIASTIYPKNDKATDILFNLNWIMIGSAAYGRRIKNAPSQAQINTMVDLGIKRIRDDNGILYEF